ncbi:hypothetical protein, partial [Sansalvadorimonas verongulae]|uniref:hypothetical protein n=1 Tax=Sansalvadorimonas verongulae TaxID=2172824 RepID=UPI001E57F769
PGWDHNPGETRQQTLNQTKLDKRLKLFEAQQKALGRSDAAIQRAKYRYKKNLQGDTRYKHLKSDRKRGSDT